MNKRKANLSIEITNKVAHELRQPRTLAFNSRKRKTHRIVTTARNIRKQFHRQGVKRDINNHKT